MLQVVFCFEENDNPPLADLYNKFVKVNVGQNISSNTFRAFLQAVLKANRRYIPVQMLVPTLLGYKPVDLEDILFITVCHHTLLIHCKNEIYLMPGNLTKIEEHLGDYGFIRAHKQHLVSFNKIQKVCHDKIIMQNNETLHIGKTYQKKIRELVRQKSF